MRLPALIASVSLLASCATEKQQRMVNASKYEKSSEALQTYLHAYGDGFQRGCLLPTVDYSPPPELVYTNSNSLLQSAGVDGFADGQRAASRMITEYMTRRLRPPKCL